MLEFLKITLEVVVQARLEHEEKLSFTMEKLKESFPFALVGFSQDKTFYTTLENEKCLMKMPLYHGNKRISHLCIQTEANGLRNLQLKLIVSAKGLARQELSYNATTKKINSIFIAVPEEYQDDLEIHFEVRSAKVVNKIAFQSVEIVLKTPGPKDILFLLQKAQQDLLKLTQEVRQLKQNPFGSTLLEAVKAGRLSQIESLINLGADVNTANELGQTALHLSLLNNFSSISDYLASKGADLECVDAKNNNLIETMALTANTNGLTWLIRRYSKTNGIHFLKNAYDKIQRIEGKDHANARELLANHMLVIAVKQNNVHEVKSAVLEYHADINAQEEVSKETALHKASYLSCEGVVEFLLEAGAKTDFLDQYERTAGSIATGANKARIEGLIKHFEVLNSIKNCDKEGVQKQLKDYALLEKPTLQDGDANLVIAALKLSKTIDKTRRLELLRTLLDSGESVNAFVNGSTPLHEAVALDTDFDTKDAIVLLIKAGALKGNTNNQQKTAIEHARALGKSDLADFMIEQFAKNEVKKKHSLNSGGAFFAKPTQFALENEAFEAEENKTANTNHLI